MNEVLKNIWDWIDLYAFTLFLITAIVVLIIVTIVYVDVAISHKKASKKLVQFRKDELELEKLKQKERIDWNPFFERHIKTCALRDSKGRFISSKSLNK